MASKKRPTSDEVKGLLLEGNFGRSDEPIPLTDPISTTQMVLKLSDIKPYDKNPRRERNPAYDDIKASILSKKKLNNNFNVTRRPGDDLFMVESGGNTRLQILKELYLETGDEKFNTVHCLFVPWKSESAVLTAHLIENEMRGDMILVDKAFAVRELKKELENEAGKELSDREFIRLTASIGYKISRTHLIRFNYAITLDQMIPQVMHSGIGGHKIDHIKKVENAYRQYCKDKTDHFDAAFMNVMANSDDKEFWDFDQVRLDLDDQLSELTGIRANLLRLEVDAIVFNQPVTLNKEEIIIETENYGNTLSDQESSTVHESIPSQAGQNDTDESLIPDEPETETLEGNEVTEPPTIIQSHDQDSDPIRSSVTTPKKKSAQEATDLNSLWQKGLALAEKIARSAGIEEAVMPAKAGMGFFTETPKEQIAESVPKYSTWWLLHSISEQQAGESHYPMWSYSDLYYRFSNGQKTGDNGNLTNIIGYAPNMMVYMYQYLHNAELLSDQAFTDIFRLMENCRFIRKNFTEEQIWTIHD